MQFSTLTTVFALLVSQISAIPTPTSPLVARNGPLAISIIKYTSAGNHVALIANTTPAGLSARFDAVYTDQSKTAWKRSMGTKATNYLDTFLPHSEIPLALTGGLDTDTGYDIVAAYFAAAALPTAGQDCYYYVKNCMDALEINGYLAPGASVAYFNQMEGASVLAKLMGRQTVVDCGVGEAAS